ncbi:MAG TPA: RNA methyltransferase [Cryomorphaceae bacterium]|nr:RNA methyltransferase [Cryomorphaceae bacterium]
MRRGRVIAEPLPATTLINPATKPPTTKAINSYHSIIGPKLAYICSLNSRKVLENKDYRLIVKTLYGLEEILSKELLSLGGREIQKINRAVAVVGDLGFVYKINIALRTGLRVLLPLNEIQMETVDDYYDAVYEVPWEELFDEGKTFAVHVVGTNEELNHSSFAGLKAKDAIVDRFRDKLGIRPSVDKYEPEVPIHIHISRDTVRIYLDTSGESLHRRGYRLEAAKAPLNEVLAAGIILHSSWNGGMPVLDPMCGSGTFLVEAALIAHNMPANIYRESFAFFNWKGFEEDLFVKIREGLLSRAKDYEGKFFGRDIDVYSLDAAAANIERSMFEDAVRLKRADFFEADPPAEKGLLLINPPYNVRIQADTHQMYRQIGDTLKEKYAGWQVFWITSDMEAIKSIGLRPSRKWNLFNGELECKLLRFDMYEGTKKLHKLNR